MNKSILTSKTFWGIIIAMVSIAASKFFHTQLNLKGTEDSIIQIVTGITTLFGMGLGVYGRVVAEIKNDKAIGKPWYKSQTILSIGAAALITILGFFNVHIPIEWLSGTNITPDDKTQALGDGIAQNLTLLYAFIGRVKTQQPIK